MQYFFLHLVYTGAWIRQIKYMLMKTKEGSTNIVNFITHAAEVFILGYDHIIHYSVHSLLPYQYTAHLLLLYWGIIMLLSYPIVDSYLFYDGVVDMQLWFLLTRSQCRVSDTQVTVKVCGPLELHYRSCYGARVSKKWSVISFLENKSSLRSFYI